MGAPTSRSLLGSVSALVLLLGAAPSAWSAEDDFCSLFKEAVSQTTVCELGACGPAKTTVSCKFPVPDPRGQSHPALDNITATGDIIVCAKPSKPASITLTVGETAKNLSKSHSWKAGETVKVPILPVEVIPDFASLEVDATVGLGISADSAHIGVAIDVCASIGVKPLIETYCGSQLDGTILPVLSAERCSLAPMVVAVSPPDDHQCCCSCSLPS